MHYCTSNENFSSAAVGSTLSPGDVTLQLFYQRKTPNLFGKKRSHKDTGLGEEIRINKRLLSSQSPVFDAMLNNGMRESTQNKIKLVIGKGDLLPFRQLLEYIDNLNGFTSMDRESEFSSSSLEDLCKILALANQFQIRTAIDTVSEKLFPLISLKDSERFLDHIASRLYEDTMEEHQRRCFQFLQRKFENFDLMWGTHEFLQMKIRSLELLLRSDRIRVQTENTIWRAVLKWVSFSSGRTKYWDRLHPLIRFHHMTPDFLYYLTHFSKKHMTKKLWLKEKIEHAIEYQSATNETGRMVIANKHGLLSSARSQPSAIGFSVTHDFRPAQHLETPSYDYLGYLSRISFARHGYPGTPNGYGCYVSISGFKSSKIQVTFKCRFQAFNLQRQDFDDLGEWTQLYNESRQSWGKHNIFGQRPMEDYSKDGTIRIRIQLEHNPANAQ